MKYEKCRNCTAANLLHEYTGCEAFQIYLIFAHSDQDSIIYLRYTSLPIR